MTLFPINPDTNPVRTSRPYIFILFFALKKTEATPQVFQRITTPFAMFITLRQRNRAAHHPYAYDTKDRIFWLCANQHHTAAFTFFENTKTTRLFLKSHNGLNNPPQVFGSYPVITTRFSITHNYFLMHVLHNKSNRCCHDNSPVPGCHRQMLSVVQHNHRLRTYDPSFPASPPFHATP